MPTNPFRLRARESLAALAAACLIVGCAPDELTVDDVGAADEDAEADRFADVAHLEREVAHPRWPGVTIVPDERPMAFEAATLGSCFTEWPDGIESDLAMFPDFLSRIEGWYRLPPRRQPDTERVDEVTVRIGLHESERYEAGPRESLEVEVIGAGRALRSLELGAEVYLGTIGRRDWTHVAVAVRENEAVFLTDCGYGYTSALAALAEAEGVTPAELFKGHVTGTIDIPRVWEELQPSADELRREQWQSLPVEVRPLHPDEAPPEIVERLESIRVAYAVEEGRYRGWLLCLHSELGSSGCSDLGYGPSAEVYYVDRGLPVEVSLVHEKGDGTLGDVREIARIKPQLMALLSDETAIELENLGRVISGRGELIVGTIATDAAVKRLPELKPTS